MRVTPLPEFQSEAILPATDFAAIDALLRHEAREHGLDLHQGHGRSVWCQVEIGEFGAKKRGDDVLIFARAHHSDGLAALQDTIAHHLAEVMPEKAALLRWSSASDAGQPPANFSLATAGKVQRVARDFLRLRLHGDGLARLAHTDSLHFRLVLPRAGDAAPEWPRLGSNGQIQWPKGDKALHRPVYTVRDIDPPAGWLETDIFLHPGGRISDWASALPLGQTVGLIGPAGGGVPNARHLILAGDETAYPAMARITQARPDAVGQVWLLGRATDYPWPDHAAMRVTHLPGGDAALAEILRENPPAADAYLWMATEKAAIARLRTLILNGLGHDAHLSHLAAYWSA